jgi:arylsulfatase A-like enzyme
MPQKSPNILWVCSDQQRFDTLGCYGNKFTHSPNIDTLAGSGTLFESAYCQSPVCTPSRSSFLTGRYPRTTRCRQNGQSIPADEVLVTRLLADAGYTCGLSGKLHLSACHPKAAPVRERRINDGYSIFNWSHHPSISGSKDSSSTGSEETNWPTNEYNLWLTQQGRDFESRPIAQSPHVSYGMPKEFHQTTWCVNKAMEFIEHGAKHQKPWAFTVNIYDPHHPFDPPEEFLRPYLERLEEIPLPNYVPGELANKPEWQTLDSGGAYGGTGIAAAKMSPQDHRCLRAAYWAMCDLIDLQMGRLMESLKGSGQLENTLVIYMSDHGEMLGDHGIYLKGPYFYEPAVHVPLIISWAGKLAGGRRSKALVELVDLAPTLLEAAGLPRYAGMQGRSLWPLLIGQENLNHHRDDVHCEFYNGASDYGNNKPFCSMVRDDRWKLVAFHGVDQGELYDLQTDPRETHNLWADPASTGQKLRLLKCLCDRMAQTVDPLPVREAIW